MAAREGMRDLTITINGMSKTYSVTGWRVGWAIAPPGPTAAIRKVHDFLSLGAASLVRQAGAMALKSAEFYYRNLANSYNKKRERFVRILTDGAFTVFKLP